MTKSKKYKYLGRNGVLVTRILIDGVNNIPMMTLIADDGKILTNGEILTRSITVEKPYEIEIEELTTHREPSTTTNGFTKLFEKR